ncbi:hypothetical protein A3F66_01050 [candidate division TM6 bacterium RIFCSPHIGHO2_12_FULL_32_22]|nr:MAG: hypothetical protein A3F66_01050 [candidate division TM6 bacterium RIFCSPHIGHO2_12_FULL_32_22]
MKKILFLFAILALNSVKSDDDVKPQPKESENIIASAFARRFDKINKEAKTLQNRRDQIIDAFKAFQACQEKYRADYLEGKNPNYNCLSKLNGLPVPDRILTKEATKKTVFNDESRRDLDKAVEDAKQMALSDINKSMHENNLKNNNLRAAFATFKECNVRYQADYTAGKQPEYNCFEEFINRADEAQVAGWLVYYSDNYYNPQLKRALKKEALAEMQK